MLKFQLIGEVVKKHPDYCYNVPMSSDSSLIEVVADCHVDISAIDDARTHAG